MIDKIILFLRGGFGAVLGMMSGQTGARFIAAGIFVTAAITIWAVLVAAFNALLPEQTAITGGTAGETALIEHFYSWLMYLKPAHMVEYISAVGSVHVTYLTYASSMKILKLKAAS